MNCWIRRVSMIWYITNQALVAKMSRSMDWSHQSFWVSQLSTWRWQGLCFSQIFYDIASDILQHWSWQIMLFERSRDCWPCSIGTRAPPYIKFIKCKDPSLSLFRVLSNCRKFSDLKYGKQWFKCRGQSAYFIMFPLTMVVWNSNEPLVRNHLEMCASFFFNCHSKWL